jgi:PAS domain S-box-containing protein
MTRSFNQMTGQLRALYEALQRSEEHFRSLIENASAIISILDDDGTVRYSSPSVERLLGYKPDDLNGESILDFVHPDDVPSATNFFMNATQNSGIAGPLEFRIRHKDSSWRILEAITNNLLDDPAVMGVVVNSHDITERKRAGEELRQYREHLEELVEERTAELAIAKAQAEEAQHAAEAANRAKSAFLANMSHELRTPLNAILGFIQLMRRDPAFPANQRDNLRIMHRSSEHLLELINDVLEMSKIEAGRTTLDKSDFDLYRLLDTLESMFSARAQNKGLQLWFERAPDVPQYIHSDERKLCQVLINLLSNAVKFTEEGGVTLRVASRQQTVDGRQKTKDDTPRLPSIDHCLHFEVEDTGMGIAPEEMAQLFKSFTHTASGQEVLEGTGLGLLLSRRFVELMGGDIIVESQVGQGSVFRFDIQATVAEAGDVQAQQSAQQVAGLALGQQAADGGPYRILVAEDREASRALLVQLLTAVGFDVRKATNGKEAVAVWEDWNPHLIWMDMRMPVMDGYKATRHIKATIKGQDTAIIALTASAFEEERADILAAGCDDLVHKPFREAEIFEVMAKHLGVRYVYEDLAQPVRPAAQVVLTPADLAALPTDWIAGLRQAAMQGESGQVLALLDQLSPDQTLLSEALAALVHSFRFDKIVALTQEKKDNAHSST